MSGVRYDLLEDLEDVRAELDAAQQVVTKTQDRRVDLIRQAHEQGFTLREIAQAAGLSHQRVAQLVNGS